MKTGAKVRTAMVLAAGLGNRMRPLTETVPKPLVAFDGTPLIDHVLERLVAAGVERVVVNAHYLADQVEDHLARRGDIDVVVSDERDVLLDTGGGVKKALRLLGDEPFFVVASDTVWIEGPQSNLRRLAAGFDPAVMDMRLLVAATAASVAPAGQGDFAMDTIGRLRRRREMETVPFTYASALITTAAVYEDVPDGAFSNNLLFDRAIGHGRLYGQRLDGIWMHIGTPAALAEAEAALTESV